MNGPRKTLILPVLIGLVSLVLLDTVYAEPSQLFVGDVEFSSDWVRVGEEVNIKMNITNLSEHRQRCNVAVFCGGNKLKQEEITIEPQSSVPLHYSFDTSGMSAGTYSIETLIESSDEQRIYYLGGINLLADLILTDSIVVDSFDAPIFLMLIPFGIIAIIILVFTSKEIKKLVVPEGECGLEVVPKLLSGIFNIHEKEEPINSEAENLEGKISYIC